MENIEVYEKESMILMEKNAVNDENLFELFSQSPDRTVYVISEDQKLHGIITVGNFRRYLLEQKCLINMDFTYLPYTHIHEVEKKFNSKPQISSIPIVDDDGRIIKEYQKEVTTENYEIEWQKDAIALLQNVLLSYKEIIVISEKNVSSTGIEDDILLSVLPKSKLHFKDSLSIKELKNIKKGSLVYDLRYDICRVTSPVYTKYCIDHICYIEKLFISYVLRLLRLYQEVGIITSTDFLDKVFQNIDNVHIIKLMDIKWNVDRECYEYSGSLPKDIEVFFHMWTFKNNYLLYKNKHVPIIVPFYQNDIYCGTSAGRDEDIAFNIIPLLKKNGVSCLVFENASVNYKGDIKKTEYKNPELFYNYRGKYSKELEESCSLWTSSLEKKGYPQFMDIKSQYINYYAGERYTCGNPKVFERTLYLFGPCFVMGSLVADEDTLGSLLKNKVDDDIYVKNMGSVWETLNFSLREEVFSSGDIVLIFACNRRPYDIKGIPVQSFLEAFMKVPNLSDCVLEHIYHCNRLVMRHIADKVYDVCISQDIFSALPENNSPKTSVSFGSAYNYMEDKQEISVEVQKWLSSILQYKSPNSGKKGCIVMNCNPFTKGHRYLIEESSKMVDVLYIFVVEENKSFFDFKDRFQMVKIGVKDLDNVIVIPSGKYMISTITLSGYFEKESNPLIECDAATDLEIFAKIIAKEFNISVRFAGEEPVDAYTRQYNQAMRTILPKYGIEFHEIPRIYSGDEVISASRVRAHIENNKFEEIQNLVLPEIYHYIKSVLLGDERDF